MRDAIHPRIDFRNIMFNKNRFHSSVMFIGFISLSLITSCGKQEASVIFHNGVFHSLDSNGTIFSAMAVHDGKILMTGTLEEVESSYRAEELIDLNGGHVFPGFTDAHAHLFGLGEELEILTLHDTRSPEEVASLVANRNSSMHENEWIIGRGWDQNKWSEKDFPTKILLDKASPSHPVLLKRIDGHAIWVNSKALELAGITRTTPDPSGGKIVRTRTGEPTGVLIDEAAELVKKIVPAKTIEQYKRTYRAAIARCLELGLTGVHDMGVDSNMITAYRQLIDEGMFPFRVVAYIDGLGTDWEKQIKAGRQTYGNDRLTVAGLKLYADGALGSRGALLFTPYSDAPDHVGFEITSPDEIARQATRALEKDLQVCVHAIGDKGNHQVLNAYERALGTKRPKVPLRIEHVQVLQSSDIPRFAQLGVIPSMQPTHCTSDMYWAEARLGPDRIRGAYAWRSLIENGSWIPGGSDFPVERPAPLDGIYAACTRKDKMSVPSSQEDISRYFQTGSSSDEPDRYKHGWYGEERMTRREALHAFTINAARAAGLGHILGSLEKGKYADFVILSGNLEEIPDQGIPSLKILATYMAGEKVYSSAK